MALGPSPSNKRLAGVASLIVGGAGYLITKSNYQVATVKRETLIGQDSVHGFKETPNAPFISATIRDAFGMSVADFNAMVDVNVVLQLANGKTITGDNMWAVDVQEVDTMEATFDVKFEGGDVSEQ